MPKINKLLVACHIYNFISIMVLEGFFIAYCIMDKEFLLHLVGVFVALPGVIYTVYWLMRDIRAYRQEKSGA